MTTTSFSDEASWDAIHDVVTERAIRWDPDPRTIRLIIFVSDEYGQTFEEHYEAQIAAILQAIPIAERPVFFGFVDWNYAEDFDQLASVTGGKLYFIRDFKLLEIINDTVGPVNSDTCN
jgi:hypothetical protein